MKALVLNGSLEHQTHLMPVQEILESEFSDAGWEYESLILHRFKVGTCIGCFRCWDTTPGICFQDDQGIEIAKKAINCDLIVFLTPLTWGGYSSELKKAIERMLGLLHPSFIKIEEIERHSLNWHTPKHRAEVFLDKDKDEKIRDRISNILIEMEVKK